MEEDINILTAFLLANIPEIITQEEFDEVKQAIENLIKGYRKLEVENAELNMELAYHSIPKSKVKEKIEEFEAQIDNYETIARNSKDIMFVRMMGEALGTTRAFRDLLQELMEDK